MGVRPHRQTANRVNLPAASLNLFQENFPRKPRTLGIQRSCTAIDVVVAGAAGGKFEVSQAEGFLRQEAKKLVFGSRHNRLRYHAAALPSRSQPALARQMFKVSEVIGGKVHAPE